MAVDDPREPSGPSRRTLLAMLAGGGAVGISAGYFATHKSSGTHADSPRGPDLSLAKKTVYFCSGDAKIYAVNAATSALRWSRDILADSTMSPAIYGRLVYAGGRSNVYALDASTGAVKWTVATDLSLGSSPAVVDGTVYIGGGDATLHALDAESGSRRWGFKTGFTSVGARPVVIDDTVYFTGEDTYLYALHAHSGSVRWRKQVNSFVGFYSDITVSNGLLYTGVDDTKAFAAFDIETGARRWSRKGVASTPAVIANGVLYISIDLLVYALDPLTGKTLWSHRAEAGISAWSPTSVANEVVYVGFDHRHGGGGVRALDARTGKVRWTQLTDGETAIAGPQALYGVVYVGSDNYLFALDAVKGAPIWSYRTAEKVQSIPVVG